MNTKDICVFDFETGGLVAGVNEAISVAAKMYNARTLEPYPDGEFDSLMKPLHPDKLDDRALAVNKITRDQLFGNKDKGIPPAPEQAVVWKQFIDWVGRWNPRKNALCAPIACGKNIRNFDLKFVRVLNELHSPKREKTVLFNSRRELELEDIIFMWFENEKEPEKEGMDTLREFFGISKEGAHSALVDVRQTGALVMRFLKLHRTFQAKLDRDGNKLVKFKGSFSGVAA